MGNAPAIAKTGRAELDGHQVRAGPGRLQSLRRLRAEAKAAVVDGFAEDDDRRYTLRAAQVETTPHQRGADPLSLPLRKDRQRREGGRRDGSSGGFDWQAGEEDVSDDFAVDLGHETDEHIAGGVKVLHEIGLGIAAKRGLIDGADGVAVVRAFFAQRDAMCVHAAHGRTASIVGVARQGEAPAGMAAGASFGDEGQGREGDFLDTSYMSNDGTRSAVPASLMNVQRIDRATRSCRQ